MDSDSDEERHLTHVRRRTKSSQAPLLEDLPLHSLQAQIFLPAALKMRKVLVM
jgi:hypothetical protein